MSRRRVMSLVEDRLMTVGDYADYLYWFRPDLTASLESGSRILGLPTPIRGHVRDFACRTTPVQTFARGRNRVGPSRPPIASKECEHG